MRRTVILLLLLLAPLAYGQHALEIIPLRHRTVDQVLPTLRPLLAPGGTLTGQANQLIVRTSAGVEAGGRVGSRGARVDVRAHDSRSAAEERVDQRVQVLEGSRAYIATGRSTGVPQRQIIHTPAGVVAQDTMVVHETSTGFDAVPRLSGDTVFLDILPQRDASGGQFQRAGTTASGRLGEWFEIGGATTAASRDERGIASASRSQASESLRIWVKVEEMRP